MSRDFTNNTLSLCGIPSFNWWTLGSTASPLPVEIMYFTAEMNTGTTAKLGWATASESNNDKFIIQRSLNGVSFIDVGNVSGKGTTQTINHYQYIDTFSEQAPKFIYYRLKQQDFNGTYKYSPIRKLTIPVLQNTVMNVYYSKTAQKIFVSSSATENLKAITVAAVNGQVLVNQNFRQNAANSDIQINSGMLTNGIYLVNLYYDTGVITTKLVVY
jgi:hypothetical protein